MHTKIEEGHIATLLKPLTRGRNTELSKLDIAISQIYSENKQ